MTISVPTNRVTYEANGSQTTFQYTFKIFKNTDLSVYNENAEGIQTQYTLNTHYTITGVGNETGGNVVFTSPPADGLTIILWGTYDYLQEIDYKQGDAFPSENVEDGIDKLTMLAVKNKDEIDRAPKVSIASTTTDIIFPIPEAEKLIGWDEDGENLRNWDNPQNAVERAEEAETNTSNSALEAYSWANYPEDSEFTNSSGTSGFSSYHWYKKTDLSVGSVLVNKYEYTVAVSGTDTFTLPWEVSPAAENLSIFADGVRVYPSDFSLSDSTTVTTSGTYGVGVEMLFVSSAAQTGYLGLLPVPAEDGSDAGKLVWVSDEEPVYELINFPDVGFEEGTKMWFYQNTAPSGWAIVDGVGDTVLAVKGGSYAYNVDGGSIAGTWTIETVGTVTEHTHSTANHTLSVAEMPLHNHSGSVAAGGAHGHSTNYTMYVGTGGKDGAYGNKGYGDEQTSIASVTIGGDGNHTHSISIGNSGGNAGHNHGETGPAQAQSSGGTSSDWRPYAGVGIIARKLEFGTYGGGGGSPVVSGTGDWYDVTSNQFWDPGSSGTWNPATERWEEWGPPGSIDMTPTGGWYVGYRFTKMRITGAQRYSGEIFMNQTGSVEVWRETATSSPWTTQEFEMTADVMFLAPYGFEYVTKIEVFAEEVPVLS